MKRGIRMIERRKHGSSKEKVSAVSLDSHIRIKKFDLQCSQSIQDNQKIESS
jgi:hypothetical protein